MVAAEHGSDCPAAAYRYISLDITIEGNRMRVAGVIAAAFAALGLVAAGAPAAERPVLVFAAASMKNALDDVAAQWQRTTGKRVAVSYAASSTLARQIAEGAPAALYVSADLKWMDWLDRRRLLKSGTRRNLLGNALVLIAPAGSSAQATVAPGFPLAKLLDGGRLAVANTDAVPAGLYAKAALKSLGVWATVADHLAEAQNVRAALALVARAETPLGIVYRTDAVAEPKVRIVASFPDKTHPPIVYPAALIAGQASAAAAAFLAYMESPAAQPLFARQGFAVLGVD
jgi:molybdate transport system substrate-binding protein